MFNEWEVRSYMIIPSLPLYLGFYLAYHCMFLIKISLQTNSKFFEKNACKWNVKQQSSKLPLCSHMCFWLLLLGGGIPANEAKWFPTCTNKFHINTEKRYRKTWGCGWEQRREAVRERLTISPTSQNTTFTKGITNLSKLGSRRGGDMHWSIPKASTKHYTSLT
jgi:hypothetical protein